MQQKIQFIATIVHDPDILILDEPFSGLDPLNVALMREYFLEFRARGKTIIFCTHVLEQAEKLCDEIMPDGPLEEDPRGLGQGAQAPQLGGPAPPDRRMRRLAESAAFRESRRRRRVDGEFVVALEKGVDQRDFLKRALDRYTVEAFSQKEPDLEEIYIDAVRNAGIEETRTIE